MPAETIGAQQDDPEITPRERCRYDWMVPIGERLDVRAPIRHRRLDGGTVARLHVAGDLERCARAWEWVFRVWLPRSGCEPADAPAREHFLDGGRGAPPTIEVLCVLPIRSLR
ncbi:MAG: GyrI-like domain-containing protein [Sandaracinaceae bacterium]